ncbi:MAG TPA: hypothetical protein VFU02_16595 [Polyangiaceae bacterium]|nr:hypothetical protein [Polyangiaceae bacterium]
MKPDAYMLSVKTRQCRAYVRLNGVPFFEADLDRPRDFGEVVTMWVMPGTNRLDVAFAVAPNNERTNTSVSLEILRVPDAVGQKEAPRVLEFAWPPRDVRELVPFYHIFEFPGPELSPCRLWTEAAPLYLDASSTNEVTAIAEQLHRTFAARDHQRLADAMAYRGRDIALCLGMTEDAGERSQKSFFKTIMTHPDFRAVPWDPEAFEATLVAGDRVVWLHRKSKKLNETLLLENNHGQGMDAFVAKIAGKWQVVR